jgi:single-strand DNA-binding protein
MGLNNWTFTGNLGKDAEQRFTTGGDSVVSFSVAVKSGYGDKEKTTWANCAMFGKRGESVLPYLGKGQLVGISGEVTLRSYDQKDGGKGVSLDVRVTELALLGGKAQGEQQASENKPVRQAPAPRADMPKSGSGSFDDFDSDIPFMRNGHRGAGVCWRAM